MIFKWHDSLCVGVSEIDAEHKYLVALINNAHDQFAAGSIDAELPRYFAHLIKYAERHFANEELLMAAIGFPLLQGHKQRHLELSDQVSELSEDYLSGRTAPKIELLEFLKQWLLSHVMSEDKEIGAFLRDKRAPADLKYTPAYSDKEAHAFKRCSSCGKEWTAFKDLSADKNKTVLGCMFDHANYFYNLIMFNCSCGTTLALPLTDLIDNSGLSFKLDENGESKDKPIFCARKSTQDPCPPRCACSYTDSIMTALGAPGSPQAS